MEVESRNFYLRVAGKNQGYHRQDKKFPSCDIYYHFNDTSRYAKQRGLVSSAYTVIQTGNFSERYGRTLD